MELPGSRSRGEADRGEGMVEVERRLSLRSVPHTTIHDPCLSSAILSSLPILFCFPANLRLRDQQPRQPMRSSSSQPQPPHHSKEYIGRHVPYWWCRQNQGRSVSGYVMT
ncbi:hypothetical protein E2C01_075304 [Portunus trituberculatus]|uniref:Uncharacterized protein n=1 Tax=Portunus trituberculatus TaxID=210409 RepID=A0A5B7IFI3_PORTR|nr:hypothetical protein [Portunus trituberculatus]